MKKVHWLGLAVIAILTLVLLTLNLPPRPKARATRIQAVNNLVNFSITMPSTNAPRAPATNR